MASDGGAPSIGLCSKCGEKSVETWTASPCQHDVCTKCLETAESTASCFQCRVSVAFLACPGSRNGCRFDTTKGSWKDHILKCLFLPLECPNRCGMIVVRKLLLSHLAAGCQLRLGTCQFCEETVFALEVRDHEDSCPKAPVTCPYCLQEGLKREEMAQHAEGCSKTPKPCPLREYGCDFSGMDEDIDQHLTVRNHVVCFREMKKSQREHDLQIERLKSELDSCKCDFEACKSQLDSCKNELAELSDGGCGILFDNEIEWVFLPPITLGDSLCSPLYRHRGTGAVVYFTLSSSEESQGGCSRTLSRGDMVCVTLDWYQIHPGRATNASTFTVIMYSLGEQAHPWRYPRSLWQYSSIFRHGPPIVIAMTEIARKVGTGSCDKTLFQATVTVGNQYLVSYEEED